MGKIYGLTSTREGVIRYVGKTADDTYRRFGEHLTGLNSNAAVGIWKREELWSGYDLDEVTIGECIDNALGQLESHWIARIPSLFNSHGNHRPIEATPDQKRHINILQLNNRPEFIDNWHGLVGIRWHPPSEENTRPAWGLKVYDPFGTKWANINKAFISPQAAIVLRGQLRSEAEKDHVERFGVRIPWPPDDTSNSV